MLAVEIARAATGRRLVLMARYGYHGSARTSRSARTGTRARRPWHRDVRRGRRVRRDPPSGASTSPAVILEPVMGSGGLSRRPPTSSSRSSRPLRAAGALLILDEVITLRLSTGGAAGARRAARPDGDGEDHRRRLPGRRASVVERSC